MSMTVCACCQVGFDSDELEGHICTEHLDYYPYGCGYCCHWLPTEQQAQFHADKKNHLPIKIRENPDFVKERRLREIMEASMNGQQLPADTTDNVVQTSFGQFPWQVELNTNSGSPSSLHVGPVNSQSSTIAETSRPNDQTSSTPNVCKNDDSMVKMQSFGMNSSLRSYQSAAISEHSWNRDERLVDVQTAIRDIVEQNGFNKSSSRKTRPRNVSQVKQEIEDKKQKAIDLNGKKCNNCRSTVKKEHMEAHVRKHLETRPLAACNYCNYKGQSHGGVRVHITWKHVGKSTSQGMGTRDLTDVDATMEDMYESCFGVKKQEATCADAVAVSKSLGMVRPYAKRAAKSIGTTSGPAKRMRIANNQQFIYDPPSGSLVRTSQSASGRQYRHRVCQVCNEEFVDAVASAHIYVTHMKINMLHCPYCEYGVPYSMANVKKHIATMHPNGEPKVIDKRQDPDMQVLYKQWRNRCFPDVGKCYNGPIPYSDSSLMAQETDERVDDLLTKLFGKKRQRSDSMKEKKTEPEIEITPPKPFKRTTSNSLGRPTIEKVQEPAVTIAKNKESTCLKCNAVICFQWHYRHVWKHLSEDYSINPFKCSVSDCQFEHYLRRSLDCHMSRHKKSLKARVIDERVKYNEQYMDCLKECFECDNTQQLAVGIEHDYKSSASCDTTQNHILNREESEPKEPLQNSTAHTDESLEGTENDEISVRPATPVDTWCEQCQCGFEKDEADDHVWQAHLGGIQPFQCGKCDKSFLELAEIENHWYREHIHSSSNTGEMEIAEEPKALTNFHTTFSYCFPDLAKYRRAVKKEIDSGH